jgi:hypothetical protein
MDNVRFLEQKFLGEIVDHLKKASCDIPSLFFDVKESTKKEDTELSFDLVFNLNFTVSVRIRKACYIKFNDLTIRSRTKAGGNTEIHKMEGKAQIYFYAYMNKAEDKLIKIRVVDVKAIRVLKEKGMYEIKKNADGTEFNTFRFKDIADHKGGIYKYN